MNLLLESTWSVLGNLPSEILGTTAGVGVTGQMHSLALLNRQQQAVTPLITWLDKRCLAEVFLDKLNQKTGARLHSEFGCATLAWLVDQKQCPADTHCAFTVQDLLVSQLCELPEPIMDPTHAASWGLFDPGNNRWDEPAIQKAGIPVEWFPKIVTCGVPAGAIARKWAADLGYLWAFPSLQR